MSIAVAENSVSTTNSGSLLAATDARPPRSGEGRVRLPNKTQWSLDDILDAAQGERALMDEILNWIERAQLHAKGRYDTAGLVLLGELSNIVAHRALRIGEIERMAADARAGIYKPPKQEPRKD